MNGESGFEIAAAVQNLQQRVSRLESRNVHAVAVGRALYICGQLRYCDHLSPRATLKLLSDLRHSLVQSSAPSSDELVETVQEHMDELLSRTRDDYVSSVQLTLQDLAAELAARLIESLRFACGSDHE